MIFRNFCKEKFEFFEVNLRKIEEIFVLFNCAIHDKTIL